MFLTRRQVKQLTGLPCSDPEAQRRNLDERGIRHCGINAAGLLVVPCASIENPTGPAPAIWSPDFSKVEA